MSKIPEEYKSDIAEVLGEKITDEESVSTLVNQLLKGAKKSLELDDSFEEWLSKRFKYQFLWLDRDDYSKALIRALWLAPRFAGTDFGSSRQRDMAQVWTDTARGFLGEIVLSKFLFQIFGIETKLDTRRGELAEFLPTDIAQIKLPGEDWRAPNLNISLKTTKFNGRWLDLPGSQFEHSDVFVLIKIGVLRQHFLAFLKAVSFLRDKLFVTAKDLGELDDENASELWNEIPEFEPIPAYSPGFLVKGEINQPVHSINAKVKGRKNKCIAITQGIGLFSGSNIRDVPEIRALDPTGTLRVEIEPIIDSLTGAHFLANSGSLRYGEDSWKELIGML